MPNTIEKYASIMQEKLDNMVVQQAASGWMESNASQVIYNGGKDIEIATLSTTGLKDYDRDNGFVKGALSLTYQKHTMTQDRGTTFLIDRMDNDETAFQLNATAAIAQFQKSQVIPEIDAYRYSKLAQIAIAANQTKAAYTPAANTVLGQLLEDLAAIEDLYGEDADIVISMTGAVKRMLGMSAEFQRMVGLTDFKRGEINTKVQAINDHPILAVPSARFKTKYQILDGKTTGQEAGGFKVDASALDINWLIAVRQAPLAINKTDKLRIFAPDVNQTADAWKIDYRKYHDLWVKKQQEKGLFVNTAPKV